jgi:hypothetical protein
VSQIDAAPLDAALGVTGTAQAGMYKASFPRTISSEMCGGCTLSGSESATMGIYTWAAFGGTNDSAAVDGDFAATDILRGPRQCLSHLGDGRGRQDRPQA